MKTNFNSIIEKKADMEVLHDENLKPQKIFINWGLEVLKTTSKANIEITIDSVYFYGTNDLNGEPIDFELAPENATLLLKDTSIIDDIFPKIFELDSETKKYIIGF
jgi:hypothetical protein